MRDGRLRRAVKRVARWSFDVNAWAHRLFRRARGERPYVLGGACRRSGACCEAPGIRVGRLVWSLASLRRPFLWWQERVNGFVLVGRDPRARVFVFRCTHFDPPTRSCDSYDSRPGICRDYPRALMWQPHPELLAPCGFRPVAPNAAALRAALEERGLTPEQKSRLFAGLHLEE
jgi:Fe-S-cluster containining protein